MKKTGRKNIGTNLCLRFQFVTMPGTDEKLRLVPVVSTILKLSPEEIKAVQQSIQGE